MTPPPLIFDLDGVIAATADDHYPAWQRLADGQIWPIYPRPNE